MQPTKKPFGHIFKQKTILLRLFSTQYEVMFIDRHSVQFLEKNTHFNWIISPIFMPMTLGESCLWSTRCKKSLRRTKVRRILLNWKTISITMNIKDMIWAMYLIPPSSILIRIRRRLAATLWCIYCITQIILGLLRILHIL